MEEFQFRLKAFQVRKEIAHKLRPTKTGRIPRIDTTNSGVTETPTHGWEI